MDDAMGAKPGQVTAHYLSTVMYRVDFSGDVEVSPQAIVGTSVDAVLHGNPSIHSWVSVVQRLTQGPGHNGGDPLGLASVIQEKDGITTLKNIPQIIRCEHLSLIYDPTHLPSTRSI